MKKILCVLSVFLILFMTVGITFASELEEDNYDYPPNRKASEEEIYELAENFIKEHLSIYEGFHKDKVSYNWYEKGPKVKLNTDMLNKYALNVDDLAIYNVYVEDVLFEYPYYSIIVNFRGIHYDLKIVKKFLDNNTFFTRGFIAWWDDPEGLYIDFGRTVKIYAEEDNGKLKYLDSDFEEFARGGFESFKTNYENFRGFIYKKHPKEGYEVEGEYYYDQLMRALKGQDVDKDLHFQITILDNIYN